MKNKSLFNQISLLISIVILLLILLLSILGSFNRVGYLSDFKLISSKNNIYTYQFRIKYNSKIFRNSDIYGVYINSKNIINANKYIRKITMNEVGSPFGILESNNKINGDINNIVYTLKLKKPILILSSVFVIILLLYSVILDFLKKLSKINFRNKYAYILIIFLCFLIMPNIIYKVFYDKFDHTNYENRKFSDKPKFDIKNLDKYPKLYETYFNDYISFRNELVKLKNILDITIFNNLTSKDLLLGKDKWLFLKWYPLVEDYIGNYKYYDQELKNAKDNLLKLEKIIKDKNIDFYLMICPDKNKIYPEYMPDYIKRIHPEYNSTDKLIEYLRKNYDIKIVYPKKELLKYKESDLLYYKYDAHWNRLGAYIGYIELMKAMNKDYIDLKDINIIRNDMGTPIYKLANMISLSESKYKYDTEYSVSNFTTNKNILVNMYNTNKTTIEHFTSNSPDRKRVVVLRDSFSQAMLDYISSNFYEVIFISIAYDDINVLDYAIKLNPDIIIYQSVERYLKYRLLNILPTYSLPN